MARRSGSKLDSFGTASTKSDSSRDISFMSNTPTRDTPCVFPAVDCFRARGPSAPRTALKVV